jgi:phage repressor protein C with HTH and peptisase S24 domain
MSKWVASALERSGLSQAALAEALTMRLRQTIDRSKVNKMVLGKRSVSADEALAIAEITGTPMPSVGREAQPRLIAVAGRVGAGAYVPLVDAFTKGDGLYHVIAPDILPERSMVAVEVEGDSMAPMYQPGHVLFFSRSVHDGILEEDIGRPCVLEDTDGNGWVKLVKRGTEPDLFHLIALNPSADSAWDRSIKWAARVILALPAELVVTATP